jgi:hypothetical protein
LHAAGHASGTYSLDATQAVNVYCDMTSFGLPAALVYRKVVNAGGCSQDSVCSDGSSGSQGVPFTPTTMGVGVHKLSDADINALRSGRAHNNLMVRPMYGKSPWGHFELGRSFHKVRERGGGNHMRALANARPCTSRQGACQAAHNATSAAAPPNLRMHSGCASHVCRSQLVSSPPRRAPPAIRSEANAARRPTAIRRQATCPRPTRAWHAGSAATPSNTSVPTAACAVAFSPLHARRPNPKSCSTLVPTNTEKRSRMAEQHP